MNGFLTLYSGSGYPLTIRTGSTYRLCATTIGHLLHLANCIRVWANNLHTFSTRGINTWSYNQRPSASLIVNGGYTRAASCYSWANGMSKRCASRWQSGLSGRGCC